MLLEFKSKHNKQSVYINVNKIIAVQAETDERKYSKIYMQDGEDSYFTVEGNPEDIALRINNYESHRLPTPESVFEKAAKNLIPEIKTLAEVIKRK